MSAGREFSATLLLLLAAWAGGVRAEETAKPPEVPSFADSARDLTRAEGDAKPAADATTPLVLALAFAPDGKTLAIGGEDPVVTLRDVATNRVRQRLTGHSEPVLALAFSPDGKTLASGGYDHSVRLWNVATGTERAAILDDQGWVQALAFAPDGKTLAVGGRGRAVRLINAEDGRPLPALVGHDGPVCALAFAPDGKTLASGGEDRVIRLWDVPARHLLGKLVGHQGTVRGLAFVDAGKTVVSASEDHTIRTWNTASRSLSSTLPGAAEGFTALVPTPRGNGFAAGAYDGRFRVYGLLATAKPEVHLAHAEGITALAFDPATGALATAGHDRAVKLWPTSRRVGKLLKAFQPATKPVLSAQLSPDGNTIAYASSGPQAGTRLIDVVTGKERGPLPARSDAQLRSHEFPAGGRLLLTQDLNYVLTVWDTRRLTKLGQIVFPPPSTNSQQRGLTLKAVTPDGRRLAMVTPERAIEFFELPVAPADGQVSAPGEANLPTPALHRIRQLHAQGTEQIFNLTFAPDGRALAVVFRNRETLATRVVVIDVAEGRERASVSLPVGALVRLAYSSDGKTLLGVVMDTRNNSRVMREWLNKLQRWSAENLSEVSAKELPPGSVPMSAFSPDRRFLALGSNQGTVQFWDVLTGQPIGTLKVHDAPRVSIEFGGDGKTLLSVVNSNNGDEPPVKLWDVSELSARK